ncbi:protein kinase domain containing protein [Stylonychia lemnae]|uniref:Protein kinase domain containing protein n=1 Tax=Stylonychia lemnae TaxID=5949 RepID=A0A078A625_STYLE|nr:protein kinase domain containing protein [Stylonychia lemnae]|eukprot:CDW77700.1 protein kinase domain containing protein [Stylonychia lemnae]
MSLQRDRDEDLEVFEPLQKQVSIKSLEDLNFKQNDHILEQYMLKFKENYKFTGIILGQKNRAVKMISKQKMNKDVEIRLRYEIDILKNLDHPNIIRILEVYEDSANIFLVTELFEGKELHDENILIGKLKEADAADIIRQVLSAIADIKAENILISHPDEKVRNKIKILDFGSALFFSTEEKMQLPQRYFWRRKSRELTDFLNKLLERNAEKRITADQAQNHPWIINNLRINEDVEFAREALENIKQFKLFDRNGDGKISFDEFYEVYKQVYSSKEEGEDQTKEALKLFRLADIDQDGAINFQEWEVDNSGQISAQEIKYALGFGLKIIDDQIWDEIVKEFDEDGDGYISFDEFKKIMQSLLPTTLETRRTQDFADEDYNSLIFNYINEFD